MTAKASNGHSVPENRTGVMTSPELTRELIAGAKEGKPTSTGDASAIAEQNSSYADAQGALGSPPRSAIGAGDAKGEKAAAAAMPVLLDMLSDRLAFERGGTRLYESLIRKAEASGVAAAMIKDLKHIYSEELDHFLMLSDMATALGGDPTVQSPSADVSGVISHGVMQVVADPRTTFVQSLQAILTAELTDNDGWQMLKEFFAAQGYEAEAKKCAKALEEEQDHLVKVRTWIKALLQSESEPVMRTAH